jgi:hypothetical protein
MDFKQASTRLMGFWRRLTGARDASRGLSEWRTAWTAAAASPDERQIGELRARLDQLAAPDDDLEIEREMLDALERLVEFAAGVESEGLPAIPTGHRVVGADVCHFIAPASMPDDPAQPGGRLLLTSARAIFVGGSRGVTLAWHSVVRPAQVDRDVILVRTDGAALYRFRCNSFDDALRGAFVARRLAGPRRV